MTVTWHVKGNLFLTGDQWSSNYRMDDRGRPVGYAYYFDFNSGKPDEDADAYSYGKRALCVRGSGNDAPEAWRIRRLICAAKRDSGLFRVRSAVVELGVFSRAAHGV